MADEDVAIKLGAFEQEALIDGFSTSASAGLNATLNSLSRWLVAAVFVIILLSRHDGEALWAASGSVMNAGLSTVLKRVLNQERPVSTIRSDPGMPSSHAQSIFYTVMFCIVSSNILSQSDEENMLGVDNYSSLCICLRVDFNEPNWPYPFDFERGLHALQIYLQNRFMRIFVVTLSVFFVYCPFSFDTVVEYFGLNGITAVISALIVAIGSYLSWLRVSQQLHTTSQVAVGAALGFSFSVFWFWLWDAIVLKVFLSHLWVQLIIVLGTAAICVTFLLYVVRYWVLDAN